MKFRREHPISGFIADFGCEAKKLIAEIDGGYHHQIVEEDIAREKALLELGWDVLRFSDEDVEQDVEAVGRAIAQHLRLEYSFERRNGNGSGRQVRRRRIGTHSPKTSAPSPLVPRDPPEGG